MRPGDVMTRADFNREIKRLLKSELARDLLSAMRQAGGDRRHGLRTGYQEQDQPGQIHSGVSVAMSRGDWSLVATLAGIVALVVAAGWGAYVGPLYGPDPKQYQAVSNGKSARGQYQGVSKSLPNVAGIPELVERAVANPPPDSGQDHEKRDLAAQESMSVWGFWMALAAMGTLVVTFVGTLLIWRQVVLTRKAVEDTSKATEAMVQQNKIAERAQRPWITVDIRPVAMSPEADEREFVFDAVFKNIGQSATEFHAFCENFHPALRDKIQASAVNREVPDRGIPILPNDEIVLRQRVIFSKDPRFLIPWVLATVIYQGENRRCAGSYVFRIEKNVTSGVQIWGGALIGPDEHALTDQIDPKREHGMTVIV